jgi:hypothetical protein
MTIRDDGNVGIGTNNPLSRLVVSGNDGITLSGTTPSNVAFQISNSTTSYGMLFGTNTSGNGFIQQRRTDATETYYDLFIQPFGGRVGIGETAPTAQLQVKSGATSRIPLIVDTLASHNEQLQVWRVNGSNVSRIDTGGYYVSPGIYNLSSLNNSIIYLNSTGTVVQRNIADANTALIINQQNAGSTGDILKVQATGTDRLVVKQNGLVSINEATPTAQLQVKSGSTSRVPIIVDSLTSHLQNLQEWKYGGNLGAFVDNEGNFFNENGTYGTISDQRLKENIVDSRNYIDDLMKLRVVKYSLKEEKSTQPTHLGFIAQEFEQVFPKMIGEFTKEIGKDIEGNAITEKYKSIKMSVLIPMLVKTIQELNKKVEELEEKIK